MKQKLKHFWKEWGFTRDEFSWIILIPPLFTLPYILFFLLSIVL